MISSEPHINPRLRPRLGLRWLLLPAMVAALSLPSLAQPAPPAGRGQGWLGAQEARADLRQLQMDLEATHPDPFLRSGGMVAFRFLDDAGQVGYFRLDSSMRYREAFEVWRLTGLDQGDWLDQVVERVTGRKASGSEAQKLALVPSVTERLMALFTDMKARRTPTLIVDLRENPGGQSVFADILEYFLCPLDTIVAGRRGLSTRGPFNDLPTFSGDGCSLSGALHPWLPASQRSLSKGDGICACQSFFGKPLETLWLTP